MHKGEGFLSNQGEVLNTIEIFLATRNSIPLVGYFYYSFILENLHCCVERRGLSHQANLSYISKIFLVMFLQYIYNKYVFYVSIILEAPLLSFTMIKARVYISSHWGGGS